MGQPSIPSSLIARIELEYLESLLCQTQQKTATVTFAYYCAVLLENNVDHYLSPDNLGMAAVQCALRWAMDF